MENFERIEKYTSGQMMAEERKKFESDLKLDPDLQQALEEHNLAIEVIDRQAEKQLHTLFLKWENEKKHSGKKKINFRILIPAAAAIFLIITINIFYLNTNQMTGSELSQKYYVPPTPPESSMGDAKIHWTNGIKAYKDKLYQEAIFEWSQISDPNFETEYYLAHAFFLSGDFNKSLTIFQKLSKGTSAYKYQSDWFTLMIYLSQNKKNLAISQIEFILSNQHHPYFKEAGEIKQKLK
jgi:hypothetical protein